jgi:hypothetical protein
MGTKSRETIYGSSIRASAERAKEARKEADRLACEAWCVCLIVVFHVRQQHVTKMALAY